MKYVLKLVALPAPLVLWLTKRLMKDVAYGLQLSKQDMCQKPLWYGFLGWIILYDLFAVLCAVILPFFPEAYANLNLTFFTVTGIYGYVLLFLIGVELVSTCIKRMSLFWRNINSRVLKSNNNFVSQPNLPADAAA